MWTCWKSAHLCIADGKGRVLVIVWATLCLSLQVYMDKVKDLVQGLRQDGSSKELPQFATYASMRTLVAWRVLKHVAKWCVVVFKVIDRNPLSVLGNETRKVMNASNVGCWHVRATCCIPSTVCAARLKNSQSMTWAPKGPSRCRPGFEKWSSTRRQSTSPRTSCSSGGMPWLRILPVPQSMLHATNCAVH